MISSKNDIVIIGFGGHARSVADSICGLGEYNVLGYTDKCDCDINYTYMGDDSILPNLYNDGLRHVVIGVGYLGKSRLRDELVDYAKKIGFDFPTIIDKSAVLARDIQIGEGCYVGKRAVINSGSVVGDFCIINTGSILEHENHIGDYSHISVASVLCGDVSVGCHSFVGASSTVIQGKIIGNNCVIGAHSTVLSDVEDNLTVYGVVKGWK